MSKIIESKAAFGAAGGGIGGALASFLLWLLGILVWHAPAAASSADVATAAVPAPVAGLLLTVLPAALALLGGYLAPHTPRPDLVPAVGDPATGVVNISSLPQGPTATDFTTAGPILSPTTTASAPATTSPFSPTGASADILPIPSP